MAKVPLFFRACWLLSIGLGVGSATLVFLTETPKGMKLLTANPNDLPAEGPADSASHPPTLAGRAGAQDEPRLRSSEDRTADEYYAETQELNRKIDLGRMRDDAFAAFVVKNLGSRKGRRKLHAAMRALGQAVDSHERQMTRICDKYSEALAAGGEPDVVGLDKAYETARCKALRAFVRSVEATTAECDRAPPHLSRTGRLDWPEPEYTKMRHLLDSVDKAFRAISKVEDDWAAN